MTPPNAHSVSRRDALKTLGAGAVLLGLGAFSGRASAADSTPATPIIKDAPRPTTQPFTLPQLPYGYEVLEPHIDRQTMELHHSKHHQAYITNANKALAEHGELKALSAEELLKNLSTVPESIRTTVRNNVGGHVNHAFFWQILAPGTQRSAEGELSDAISKTFRSFSSFQSEFSDAAMKRFGSGWAWLSLKDGKLQVHSTANQDSPLMEGATPVLGLDVWEHAYYLKYQNRRADYVAAFWNAVNWGQASRNYASALG